MSVRRVDTGRRNRRIICDLYEVLETRYVKPFRVIPVEEGTVMLRRVVGFFPVSPLAIIH